MFDYLQQFNNLPKELRDRISTPEIMNSLINLEKRYHVDLAALVMKVMIKNLLVKDLPAYFISDFKLDQAEAESLSKDLVKNIFSEAADYLGLIDEVKLINSDHNIDLIIKETEIALASADLLSRFKVIISTYLRGIRNKITTRDALAKTINLGGLNLSDIEIDRVLKVCDKFISGAVNSSTDSAKRLNDYGNEKNILTLKHSDKIKPLNDGYKSDTAEYSLKEAIASGRIVKPVAKIEPPEALVAIEAPDETKMLKESDETKMLKESDETKILPLVKANKLIESTSLVKLNKPSELTSPSQPIEVSKTDIPELEKDKPVSQIIKPELEKAKPVSQIIKPELEKAKPVSQIIKSESQTTKPGFESPKQGSEDLDIKVQMSEITRPNIISTTPISVSKTRSIPELTISETTPTNSKSDNVPYRASQAVAAARPAPQAPTASSRPILQDVKATPRIMGPIEELKFLDLVNFRRLGKDSTESTVKIFNKIKLLEADGYDKMIAGVRAWRQSPVNHLYLQMMKEAINKGKTVREFSIHNQNNKDKYLSLEEIEQIISLNSKLIF